MAMSVKFISAKVVEHRMQLRNFENEDGSEAHQNITLTSGLDQNILERKQKKLPQIFRVINNLPAPKLG